jgi:hypothetical protein
MVVLLALGSRTKLAKDHTTQRQTNLLQDGIGRYFGIQLAAISFFPVLLQCIRRRGQSCIGIESSSDHGTTYAHVSSIE